MTEEVEQPTALTKGEAFGNVYTHLKNQDIKPMVEKKKISNSFQPDFLSWTHVWEFLLQTYPDFTHQHLEPLHYPDGTMAVQCELTIPVKDFELKRIERLYVMDNRMNAITHPNAQQINKAEKRCFVKCAALFGLGIQLFTGEDLPDVPQADEPEVQQPVQQEQHTPTPEPTEQSEEEFTDPDKYITSLLNWANTALRNSNDPDSLRYFWQENKKGINALQNSFPNKYAGLVEEFQKLQTQAGGNKDAGQQ